MITAGRDHHEQRRIGEGGVEAEPLERDQPLDLELMHRVGQAAFGAVCRPFARVLCCLRLEQVTRS